MGEGDWGFELGMSLPPAQRPMNCSTLEWVDVGFSQGYYLRLNGDPFKAVEGMDFELKRVRQNPQPQDRKIGGAGDQELRGRSGVSDGVAQRWQL